MSESVEVKRKYIALIRAKAAYDFTISEMTRGNLIAIRFLEVDRTGYEFAHREWKRASENAKQKPRA